MEITPKTEFCDEVELFKRFGNQLPPPANSLNELINELKKIFDSDEVNIELVDYVLRTYKANYADWKKFAKFDRYKYTRNLVDSGNGKYNLILLCWGEGQGSSIHDHADAHCFMKIMKGSLAEVRFAWPEPGKEGEPLTETGRTTLEENSVCYINDSLGLHRVENTSNVEPAVSLHLYCPPFNQCSVFNQNTGKQTTSQVTFWSMYGKRQNTKDCELPPQPEDN